MKWLLLIIITFDGYGSFSQERVFDSREECHQYNILHQLTPHQKGVKLEFRDCVPLYD